MELLDTYYEFLVNVNPFISMTAFLVMYTYTIIFKHKHKDASIRDRIFFLILTVALVPSFLVAVVVLIKYQIYGLIFAQSANLFPVIYIIILNEYYLRKYGSNEERANAKLQEKLA